MMIIAKRLTDQKNVKDLNYKTADTLLIFECSAVMAKIDSHTTHFKNREISYTFTNIVFYRKSHRNHY